MRRFIITLGALLFAAPLFSQEPEALAFTLHEHRQQVEQRMGRPSTVTAFGDFESWQYQIGIEDHHEFSHQLVFRVSTGELISFTRNYEGDPNLDALFPSAESHVEHYPDAEHEVMQVRVRQMKDGRFLLGIGSQLMLIQGTELKNFQPWLAERLH